MQSANYIGSKDGEEKTEERSGRNITWRNKKMSGEKTDSKQEDNNCFKKRASEYGEKKEF